MRRIFEIIKSYANILVILNDLSASYVINGDGSKFSDVQINTTSNISPDYSFASGAKSAVVQGKLHLFGGWRNNRRIARLEGCTLVEQQMQLTFLANEFHAALSIDDGSKGRFSKVIS